MGRGKRSPGPGHAPRSMNGLKKRFSVRLLARWGRVSAKMPTALLFKHNPWSTSPRCSAPLLGRLRCRRSLDGATGRRSHVPNNRSAVSPSSPRCRVCIGGRDRAKADDRSQADDKTQEDDSKADDRSQADDSKADERAQADESKADDRSQADDSKADDRSQQGRRPRGTGGTVPPKFEVGERPCIGPPNI